MDALNLLFEKLPIKAQSWERVHGGDINDSFCIHSGEEKYFLKLNDASLYPRMFAQEAKGLRVLKVHTNLAIPCVIAYGIYGTQQYLLLEWLEKGNAKNNFDFDFGGDIARMHKNTENYFGFDEDNYIGSLTQINTKHKNWSDFYAECRIMPLIKKLIDKEAVAKNYMKAAENFCRQLKNIFPNEPSALLHGDLWSGNYMVTKGGKAAIYDPAVYYGHREMDIGLTKLFGGFSGNFYNGYESAYPLEKKWEDRISYTQLYPLLMHAILFGRHYINAVCDIMQPFLEK